jgi:uncharacterized protein YigE (DUF2233 family)
MKKLLIIIACVSVSQTVSHAQTKIFETKNHNIGFGQKSDCINNEYMDFCVNGPLVKSNGSAIGGYIDNQVQIQNYTTPEIGGGNFSISNGVFGLGVDGQLYMFFLKDIHRLPAMKWAIQNGPILVMNGINVRGTSQSKYERSGIGYKSDGTLCVIVSQAPITFKGFAQLFIDIGCVNAMYLDGGPYVGYSDNQTNNTGMIEGALKLQFFNN